MSRYENGECQVAAPNDSELSYVRRRSTYRKRLVKSLTATSIIAALAGGGLAYYETVPAAKINAEAAFSDDPTDERLSELAAIATGTHIRVACDNELLERGGGLVSVVGDTEYKVNGRVHPLPILVGQVALPVTVLHEDTCAALLNTNSLIPEVEQNGVVRTTHYEGPKLFARALATLLHEKEHTGQVFNEAEANCYAFQKLPDALARLGMDPKIIPIVTRAVTTSDNASLQPPNYYSPECAPGGAYDLGISDSYLVAPE